jgi:ComF family protein
MAISAAPLARSILNAVLPVRCMACGATVSDDGALCASCWDTLRFLGPPACACCGYPFEYEAPSQSLCASCTRQLPQYDRARAVFAYDDFSRSLILTFKHADRTHQAPSFGRWLARAGSELLGDADLIVPVPLHRWRLFHRRYNQSALLAQALGRESGKRVAVDLMTRRRRTPPQGRMSRAARIRNVRAAFAVREEWRERLRDARILLLDDVLTTGATVEECARVLKRGGAATVDVLTLARVIRPRN